MNQYTPSLRLGALLAIALTTLLGAALLFTACADDEDDISGPTLPPSNECGTCPSGQACVLDSDRIPVCRPTNCGPHVCADNAICVDDTCQFAERVCDPDCPSGQICVYGNCIRQYTSSNVCDPWSQCEANCQSPGRVDAVCLAACEASRSSNCLSCLNSLQRCESQNNCQGNSTDCCPDAFCNCFPGNPGCSDTPCDLCYQESDTPAELQACIEDTPPCANCLQPFFQCRTDHGGDVSQCQDFLCDCLSEDAAPECR